MKKVKRNTTGGKVKFSFRKEKPQLAKCANCKKPLHGIPKLLSSDIRKLAKSDRRPDRPFGGSLCSSCTREIFRERARI